MSKIHDRDKNGLYYLNEIYKSTGTFGTQYKQEHNNINLVADNKQNETMKQNVDYIYNDLKKMSYKEMDHNGKLPFLKTKYPSLFAAKQLLAYPALYKGDLALYTALEIKEDLLKLTYLEIAQNAKLTELTSKHFPELFVVKKFIAYPDPYSSILKGVLKPELIKEFLNYSWDQLSVMKLLEVIEINFNDLFIALKVIKYPESFSEIKWLETSTRDYLTKLFSKYSYQDLDYNQLLPILKIINLNLFEAKKIIHYNLEIDSSINLEIVDLIKQDLANLTWKELETCGRLAMLKRAFPEIYQAKYTLEFNQY